MENIRNKNIGYININTLKENSVGKYFFNKSYNNNYIVL